MENYDLFLMQDAQTTGNGNEFNGQRMRGEFVFYVTWSAGVSAGAVTIETADTAGYAGTWASLGTVTTSAASKVDIFSYTGILAFVRARISTTVAGGTVTVKMICGR